MPATRTQSRTNTDSSLSTGAVEGWTPSLVEGRGRSRHVVYGECVIAESDGENSYGGIGNIDIDEQELIISGRANDDDDVPTAVPWSYGFTNVLQQQQQQQQGEPYVVSFLLYEKLKLIHH